MLERAQFETIVKVRFDRFLKSVGAGMAGDSQAAMTELLKRGEES